MSLTDTINNTNTQKENVKTVANNIDNKLVELGGERATNLADVVNKMEGMVTTQYVKIAEGEYKQTITATDIAQKSGSKLMETEVTIPINLSFNPKRVLLYCEYFYAKYQGYFIKISLDSKKNYDRKTSIGFDDRSIFSDTAEEIQKYKYRVYIKEISRTYIKVAFIHVCYGDTRYIQYMSIDPPIKWTAIG